MPRATATCNPGGAGKWRPEYNTHFEGANVVVVADDDEVGHAHARQVADSLAETAASVKVVLPRVGKDLSDHLQAGHRLADLVPLDPVTGNDANPAVEPAAPVNGLELMVAVMSLLARFLVIGAAERVAVALWVMHTHAVAAADITPYLHVTSAEKRSGKSRLLEILAELALRAWLTGRVTAAALARKVATDQPTLLLDEADATFTGPSEFTETLRGILNTGFHRGGKTTISVPSGDGWKATDLSTFCPKVIAGIGSLPGTVADRAIRIELQRRGRTENVERLRRRHLAAECAPLYEQLTLWAEQNIEALAAAEPSLPEELDDRAQDIWEPLLAIADLLGDEWPVRARQAAVALSGQRVEDELSHGVLLLRDIRDVFDQNAPADKLTSTHVLLELVQLVDSPWGDWRGRGSISAQQISQLLKPYGIRTKAIWVENEKRRGWERAQFAEAWARYLPANTEGMEEAEGPTPSAAAPSTPATPSILPELTSLTGSEERPSDDDLPRLLEAMYPESSKVPYPGDAVARDLVENALKHGWKPEGGLS